jgi:hypothetical protein
MASMFRTVINAGSVLALVTFVLGAAWDYPLASAKASVLETPVRLAQTASPAPAAPTPTPPTVFTREELERLLAPYALYPDALLAQLLPAAAYPIEIVQASRWLAENKAAVGKGDFSAIDAKSWDPAVKALVRFPDVIEKLNGDLDATTDLGDAFVNQPQDVTAMIQDLRRRAEKTGALKSTPQQRVATRKQGETEYVVIEPADPGVIYVPSYDPVAVYDTGVPFYTGLMGFGVGVAVGAVANNVWDWGRGWVYPPRWAGYPGYRPGGGNINIGNDINIGNGDRWQPGSGYRPGQGTKPGLARPSQLPANRVGDGTRAGDRGPAGGNRVGQPGRAETRPAADRAKPKSGSAAKAKGSGNKAAARQQGGKGKASQGQRKGGGQKAASRPKAPSHARSANAGRPGGANYAAQHRGPSRAAMGGYGPPRGGYAPRGGYGGGGRSFHHGGGGGRSFHHGGGGARVHRGGGGRGGGGRGGRR